VHAAGGHLTEVRVSAVVDHVFYATVVLADGGKVDARPSDALALALVAGTPITADPSVLASSARFVGTRRPEFAAEVAGPHDGASVLADEARERVAERARKLAELDE
jgi:bifunctional DNase/RNase